MSEMYSFNPEFAEDLRTPQELLESTLTVVQQNAIALSQRSFDTPEEANSEKLRETERIITMFNGIEGVSQIPIRISGEGVKVPDAHFESVNDENKIGLAVTIPKEQGLKPLIPFEELEGKIVGVWAGTKEREDGSFQIKMNLTVGLIDMQHNSIGLSGAEFSAVDVFMKKSAFVDLSDNIEIVLPELENVRKKYALQQEIAERGLSRSLFKKQLNKLNQALHSEDAVQFTPMNNVAIIKKIGALGGVYARNGEVESTLMSEAILDTLGKGRKVGVEFFHKINDEISSYVAVNGKVMEVLMPRSSEDIFTPTLILEPDEVSEANEVLSIQFSNITAFKF